jgi:ribosomal protein L15E
LSYQLPSKEIKEVLKALALNSTESSPQKVNRHLFGHFPIGSYEADQMIPKDFKVFLVDTDLNEIRERPNHNQICAIAVSEERKTIAYLFDSW